MGNAVTTFPAAASVCDAVIVVASLSGDPAPSV
jgi:hypothetical protein